MKTRLALLATILTAAAGCDKAKTVVHAGEAAIRAGQAAEAPTVAPGAGLDLAAHPDILFEVFGPTDDPRMIPVAALEGGALKRIVLSDNGWHRFDAMYFHEGLFYNLYDDGRPDGDVRVKRGMWDHGDTLYTLPGCQALTPLAAVKTESSHAPTSFAAEYFASSAQLGHDHTGRTLSADEVARIARQIATSIAQRVGIQPRTLDSLDFHASSFLTGTGSWPTIVGSFIDPTIADMTATTDHTTHLVVIADRDSAGDYHATFIHRVHGPLATADFRRYVDHLDVNGDGVDEIVLEGWHYGMDTFLSVLAWNNGRWGEIYRTRDSWCLDEHRRTT